jgi:hypothetical protein
MNAYAIHLPGIQEFVFIAIAALIVFRRGPTRWW